MDYNNELNQIKESLERAKSLKYRAEARLEQLNKQEEEIVLELEKLGIKPNDLEKEIRLLEEDIKGLLTEATELLPKDI